MAKQFKRDRKGKFAHSKVAERTDVTDGVDGFGLVGTVIEDDVDVDMGALIAAEQAKLTESPTVRWTAETLNKAKNKLSADNIESFADEAGLVPTALITEALQQPPSFRYPSKHDGGHPGSVTMSPDRTVFGGGLNSDFRNRVLTTIDAERVDVSDVWVPEPKPPITPSFGTNA